MQTLQTFPPETTTLDLPVRYRQLLAEACRLIGSAGATVELIRPGCTSRFPSLDVATQTQIVAGLEAHNQLLSASLTEVTRSARPPSQSLTWAALKVLGLIPPKDAFSHLLDTHIVEIYSPSFTQVFRSLNFFKFVSYSLDELMTYHFSDLYTRSGSTTDEMMAMTEHVRCDLQPTTYIRPFTRCTLKETFGPAGMCVDSDSVLGASLFDHQGKFAGYLSAIEIYHSWTDPAVVSQ